MPGVYGTISAIAVNADGSGTATLTVASLPKPTKPAHGTPPANLKRFMNGALHERAERPTVGSTLTVNFAAGTKIFVNGTAVNASSLADGMNVVVMGQLSGSTLTAKAIVDGQPPKPTSIKMKIQHGFTHNHHFMKNPPENN